MKRAQIFMSKPVYLDLSILEISKIAMCEFWYDYVKPKYNEKAKLCYMDQDSLIVHIKTEDRWETNRGVCSMKKKIYSYKTDDID